MSYWFSDIRVLKVLLSPPKIRIFGSKTAKFGPKLALLVILGQILAFLAHLMPCPTKKAMQAGCLCIGGFLICGYQKFCTLLKIWGFWPKSHSFGHFWSKASLSGFITAIPTQKNNAIELPKWFPDMDTKFLLPLKRIGVFGPKAAIFGPKYAFLALCWANVGRAGCAGCSLDRAFTYFI